MKTRISRIVAMLLALALVLSMPMVASAEEDVIVLTAASCRAGQGENYNDRLITQEIENRLGIRLDVTDYAFEAWNTQLTASEWVAKKVLYVNAFKFLQYSKAYRWIDNATDEQLIQAHEIDPTYCALEITMEKNMRKVNVIDDYPLMPYMNDEAETRAYLMTDLQTYIQTMKAQFITGEADIDAQWDTFVKTLNTMGLEELLKIEQAAYDRYSANN